MPKAKNIIEVTNDKPSNNRNTDRILYPSKDAITFIPTVSFEGEDGIMVYDKWTLYFDAESIKAYNEAEKARLGEEDFRPLRQVFSFAQLHDTNDKIDIGLWMQNNTEEAFGNMVVKGSTAFQRDENNPLSHQTEYLVPCLWRNNPDLKAGEEPKEEHILKFTQRTIAKSIRTIYDMGNDVKHMAMVLAKTTKTSYTVNSGGTYTGTIPARDINVNDYTDLDDRDVIVRELARYGINVPDAPAGTVRMEEGYYLSAEEHAALST